MNNKKGPMLGKKHSEETKIKMSIARKGKKLTEEHKNKLSLLHKGKPKSEEHKKKLSLAKIGTHPIGRRGERSNFWKGGICAYPYGEGWNEELKRTIRSRDGNCCSECGIHQDEINKMLHVHHIDYNKENCNPENLITLCNSCHMKTNFNREYWIEYFNN